MAARESDSVDSGQLWLPEKAPHARRRKQDIKDITPPHLSDSTRRTMHDLLTSVGGRERLWMSPQLRTLSPAMRVKIIYELEKLGARLAQM